MSVNESYHIDIGGSPETKFDGLSFYLQSNRYKIGKQLGRGAFGIVVSAVDKICNCEVAIKQIPRVFDNLDILLYVTREILVLDILRHPNIVSLRELEFERENLFIVTEKCNANLDIFVRSKDYNRVKIKFIHQIIFQTLKAVNYMHSFNIMHRDIKPENVLLDRDLNVKLCDFGLARLCTSTINKENRNLTEYVVTRWYRAPEVILVKSGYGTKQDIWSVGCLIGFMLLRGALFPGQSAVDQIVVIAYILGKLHEADLDFIHCNRTRSFMDKINENNENTLGISQMFARVSSMHLPAISLLQLLLNFNPNRRISAEVALTHSLFDQFRGKSEDLIDAVTSPSSSCSSMKIFPSFPEEKAESLAGLACCNNSLSKYSEDELASEIIALRIRLQTQNYPKRNTSSVIMAPITTSSLPSSQNDNISSEVETTVNMTTMTSTKTRRESIPRRTNSRINQLSGYVEDTIDTATFDQIIDPLNERMVIHINHKEVPNAVSKRQGCSLSTKKSNSTSSTPVSSYSYSRPHRPLSYDINKHSSEKVCYLSSSSTEEEEEVEVIVDRTNSYEEEDILLPVIQVECANDLNDDTITNNNIRHTLHYDKDRKKDSTSKFVSMHRGMKIHATRSLPSTPSVHATVSVTVPTLPLKDDKTSNITTNTNLTTSATSAASRDTSPVCHSDLMRGMSFDVPKTHRISDLRLKAQNRRLQTITEQQQQLHQFLSKETGGSSNTGKDTGSINNITSTNSALPPLHHYSVTNQLDKSDNNKRNLTSNTATTTTSSRTSYQPVVNTILKEGKVEQDQNKPLPIVLNPYRSTRSTGSASGTGICNFNRRRGSENNCGNILNVNITREKADRNGQSVLDVGKVTKHTRNTSITTRECTRRLSV